MMLANLFVIAAIVFTLLSIASYMEYDYIEYNYRNKLIWASIICSVVASVFVFSALFIYLGYL